MIHQSENDIIISYPKAGKSQKDRLRRTVRHTFSSELQTAERTDIPAEFMLYQLEPSLKIYSENELTTTTLRDIQTATVFFTKVGRQEGIFPLHSQPEFLIVFRTDKNIGGGKLYTKENQIEMGLS